MKLAIATGKENVDNYIAKSLEGSKIVNYSDYFYKNQLEKFDIVILSNLLEGEIKFNELLFLLKQQGTRVIFLCKPEEQLTTEDKDDLATYLSYGLYDVMFSNNIKINDIRELIDNPKDFSLEYVQNLYVKYVNKEALEKNNSLKTIVNKLKSQQVEDLPNETIKYIEKIVEVEVEKEVIKPVVVEKIKTVTKEKEVIDNSVIATFSFCSTGKTFLSSVLSNSFHSREYSVNLISLDRYSGANVYFNSFEKNNSVDKDIKNNKLSNLFNNEFIKDLNLITDSYGSTLELDKDKVNEIIDLSRNKYKISIIDCNSHDYDITKSIISIANTNLFVIDTNKNHISLNFKILKEWFNKGFVNMDKTILVINNCFKDSLSYSSTLSEIEKLEDDINSSFKNIVTIENLRDIDDLIYNNNISIGLKGKFKEDIDTLMLTLKSKSEGNNNKKIFLEIIKYLKSQIKPISFLIFSIIIIYMLLKLFFKEGFY